MCVCMSVCICVIYTYIYIYTLAKEFTAAARIMQSSSTELSTPVYLYL